VPDNLSSHLIKVISNLNDSIIYWHQAYCESQFWLLFCFDEIELKSALQLRVILISTLLFAGTDKIFYSANPSHWETAVTTMRQDNQNLSLSID
jgi:hypothetical protein